MKNLINYLTLIFMILSACDQKSNEALKLSVYESSKAGNKLKKIQQFDIDQDLVSIDIKADERFQKITGIGGSFTESSAYLLNQLSEGNRKRVLEAYFGEDGARYSLTRTHINSCDFSLDQYAYANIPGDTLLNDFSIEEDKNDIIPMIKEAMAISKDGFKIIASPWTAPPWMKDNNDWVGGKLLPEYRATWALYFSKYLQAYQQEGIDIWGITVENEPLGNGNNWESMHFTPQEMTDFVVNYLGPQLKKDGWDAVQLLGYDQNREHLEEWIDEMYRDDKSRNYFDGTAIHWYASTFEVFPDALQYAHQKAPEKHLIQSEACVDAEVPKWQNDEWYWSKEATDWGWDWAPEEDKKYHPKYVPVYRYARDIIGCFNNWVDGWVDWNMVLNRQGGPNWFKNWCVAPVIVDEEQDEVYFTPLYYTLSHFSRFIRPNAVRLGLSVSDENLLATAVENTDGSIVLVVLNQSEDSESLSINFNGKSKKIAIAGQAIQSIVIQPLPNSSKI